MFVYKILIQIHAQQQLQLLNCNWVDVFVNYYKFLFENFRDFSNRRGHKKTKTASPESKPGSAGQVYFFANKTRGLIWPGLNALLT